MATPDSMDDIAKRMKRLPSVRALAIQKGVLVHEVDEGSPCLKCGDKCKGFSLHFWRKICANCHCPREEHDVSKKDEGTAPIAVGKLLFHPSATAETMLAEAASPKIKTRSPLVRSSRDSYEESPSILRKTDNFTWTPRGVSVSDARAYFEGLPVNKKPISGTPGDRYWQKQKIRQLPAHDIDLLFCNDLTNEECKQMDMFLKIRREKFLGRGAIKSRKPGDSSSTWICAECNGLFKAGEAAVFAERLPDKVWHPSCFACCGCKELLIELIYFHFEGKIYCGRHHSEMLKPRCSACDEIIFCTEYTRAEEQNWHLNHFCCLKCDKELGGQHYIAKDGHPYCLECYENMFASICESCGNTIPLDEPRLAHKEKYWHATPKCFKCRNCGKSLVDQPFLPKHGKVYCSKECLKQIRNSLKL